MDKLFIPGTKSTPEVDFNPETMTLSLKGQSYPENSFKFYEPVMEWVDLFFANAGGGEVSIRFSLPYINTSSSKCIMTLLEKFDLYFADGQKLHLYWYYNKENESELECAEEFKEDLSFPFDVIPKEEEESC
ncbi:DUF1987 domain-containing protein [Paenibacillus thermotolerans]|uniref:DUF1987 domain-containing protein n=1 Tax=Paenibacillus thermotolerans TaxID=3027807 RepID=UPI00236757A2|nr:MULTISPECIES: DUF1987 domain-containing protein [unclassified Paenibacillus]